MILPRSSTMLGFSVGPVRSLPYMGALDGLRAIAVLAVIAYHANEAWMPGGYLGVEVFFTISGYLITALLITEFDRTDRVDFLSFWKRRARRLLPALAALLAGVIFLALFVARDALGSLSGQVLAASGYVMNWSLVFTEQSYFEAFGRPPLLQHLWSLAIEEQFYLLFPPLFVAGRRLLGRHLTLGMVLAGVIASTAFMWNAFDPTVDPSRLYYGTDSRAAGILLGVALAMVWRPWAAAGTVAERLRSSPLPDIVGMVGFAFLVHQLFTLGAYDPRLYRGGFLLVAAATAAVIFAVAVPGSMLSVPLGTRVLRWIGTRSYGLYLWHWPVFMVLRPGVDTIVGEPWLTVLRLGATFALAELSYTFIERPVREGRFVQQVREVIRSAPERATFRRGVAIVVLSGLALMAIGNVQLGPQQPAAAASLPSDTPTLVSTSHGTLPKGLDPTVAALPATEPDRAVSSEEPASSEEDELESASEEPEPPAGPAPEYDQVFVVGDSVMAGAVEQLEQIEGSTVNAQIGRQWHEVVGLDGIDPGPDDAVVIHLGSNGAATTATIDAVLERLSHVKRVVLVNVRVPRPWETPVNRSLAGATGRWPNTVLADWHGASDGTPGYFAGDGVHLSTRGAEALTGTITYALEVPERQPVSAR